MRYKRCSCGTTYNPETASKCPICGGTGEAPQYPEVTRAVTPSSGTRERAKRGKAVRGTFLGAEIRELLRNHLPSMVVCMMKGKVGRRTIYNIAREEKSKEKDDKIKLWRLVRDTGTYEAFSDHVRKDFNEIFGRVSKEDKRRYLSRDTYEALMQEIMEMPVDKVANLPLDLQGWFVWLRPEMEDELKPYVQGVPADVQFQLGLPITRYYIPPVEEGIIVECHRFSKRKTYHRKISERRLLSFREAMEKSLPAIVESGGGESSLGG